jgi:cyclase
MLFRLAELKYDVCMSILPRVAAVFLLCACATILMAQGHATASGKLPFELKLIGPNIWAAIDDTNGDSGANAGFVIGDSGVVVIDTFENEVAAKALLAEIKKLTHLPVKFVVNTHYHVDHVAGNRVFSNAGAVIVAHQNVSKWINTENLKFFGDKIKPEEKVFVENLLGPEVIYESEVSLLLGSRRIDVKFFEGHTGGDSVVNIPDAGVVFCGDLFWRKTLPNLIDATTSKWIGTLSEIPALPVVRTSDGSLMRAVTFVPGHGDVGTASDVKDFQNYLEYLRSVTQKAVDEGKAGDELVNTVLPEFTQTYGSWDFFKDFSRSNILDAAAELKGSKRVPARVKK